MPVCKIKSCKGSARDLMGYLLKDGRALDCDLYNLGEWFGYEEYEFEGDREKRLAYDWAGEMDATRKRFGHDRMRNGRAPRSYEHVIISPDPADKITLPRLRALVSQLIASEFDSYQVAVVYHDDNASGVPHAHLCVNVSDLDTGLKLHRSNKYQLNRHVQELAQGLGLSAFDNRFPGEREPVAAKPDNDYTDARERAQAVTRQPRYLSRAERAVAAEGRESWKADIRARVMLAIQTTQDSAAFRARLGELGVTMRMNSPKARRRDWVYALADEPTKCVTGERLGYAYGKCAIERRFSKQRLGMHSASKPLSEMSAAEFARAGRAAVEVGSFDELDRLVGALEVLDRYNVRSLKELNDKERFYRQRYGADNKSAKRLADVRGFVVSKGLLPDKPQLSPWEAQQQRLRALESQRNADFQRRRAEQERSIGAAAQRSSQQQNRPRRQR